MMSQFKPVDPGNAPWPTRPGEVPIKDLAFLYNCRTAAAVSSDGVVRLLSVPYIDDPSVFTKLLEGAGYFRVAPAGCRVPDKFDYVTGTNVLETEWLTNTGDAKVVDGLVWTPDEGSGEMLVQTVDCTRGTIEMEVDCDIHFDYGSKPGRWQRRDRGDHIEARASHDGVEIRLRSDLDLKFDGPRTAARFTLREGERGFIVLGWGDRHMPRTFKQAKRQLANTIRGWRSWLATGNIPRHALRPEIVRDLLTMKGACLDTGAVIAAPTFSLPEEPGGVRNWDYRKCWPRDAKEVLEALRLAGFTQEGHAYIEFLLGLSDYQVRPQIMYGPRGGSLMPEKALDHLPGFGGARPVNIGNDAADQAQHDLPGQVNRTIWLFKRDQLTAELYRLVKFNVQLARSTWNVPDAGPWEQRGEPRCFNGSRLMQWAAVAYGADLARAFGELEDAIEWETAEKDMRKHILDDANHHGMFTAAPGMEAMDVFCVRFALEGFVSAKDAFFVATVRGIEAELTHKGLHRRYDNQKYGDGLPGEEMMFLIGSYWLVEAYVEMGELGRARKLFRYLRTFDTRLLLLPEEVDPETWEFWGNHPQSFVHAARTKAALALARAEAVGVVL